MAATITANHSQLQAAEKCPLGPGWAEIEHSAVAAALHILFPLGGLMLVLIPASLALFDFLKSNAPPYFRGQISA